MATIIILAGCTPAAPVPIAATGATATPQPAPTQELVVGAPDDQFQIEYQPLKARLGNDAINVNMCETLVRLGEDFSLQPLLATSWELAAPNTWRFHLLQGVTFWDGSPLTADNGTDLAQQPMCTGPFTFVEYAKAQQLVVQRNANYWGEKARLDKVTYRFYPDANARQLALQSGELDVVMDLPREQVATIKARSGLKVASAPVGRTMLMYLNIHGHAAYVLLRDRAIRQAIGFALDRQTMVDKVWGRQRRRGPDRGPARSTG
ncbi:MAG: hypothetical protein NVSMB2_11100 [Chloroflexota bacterium]